MGKIGKVLKQIYNKVKKTIKKYKIYKMRFLC